MKHALSYTLLPLVLLLAALPVAANAEDLIDVYRQARASDPVLAQADAQRLAISENVDQTRALLLPQLSASYSYNRSHDNSTSTQPFVADNGDFQVFTFASTSDNYSTTLQGQLNQTLVDFSKYANLAAAHSRAAAQEAQYQVALQNLMLRVSQAYFNVLTDEDTLRFAKAEEKSLGRQQDQAQQRYDVGLSAVTDVNEAKAQHDSAVAAVITAQNALDDAREALSEITGKPVNNLRPLRDDLPLDPPKPNDQSAWVDHALEQNPTLVAQRREVDASEHDISAARAGHLPTLDASVVYTNNPSWADQNSDRYTGGGIHTNSERTDTAVGLVLNVPIFSGGAIQSRVRQSIYQRDSAADVLEQDRRQVIRNTRNFFRSVNAGISEVDARKQAVVSAKSALDATQAGFQVGTRTIVDVLISQQQLFQAQRDYSQARHDFIINKLQLRQAAGSINVKDIEAVNALLQ